MINTGKKCNAFQSIGRYNVGLVAEVAGPVTCFSDLRVKRISKQKDKLLMWEQGFDDVIIDKSEISFLRVVGFNFPYIKGTNGVKYATYIDVLIDGTLNRLRIHSNTIGPEAKRSKKYFDGSIPVVSGWVKDPKQPNVRDEHYSDPLCPLGYSPLIVEYAEGHADNPTVSLETLGFRLCDIPSVDYLMENPYNFKSIDLPPDFVFPEGLSYSPDKKPTFEYATNEVSEKPKREKKKINKKVLIPIVAGAGALLVAAGITVPIIISDVTGPASQYEYSEVVSLSGKNGIRIDKYIGDKWNVTIPESIRGKRVVELADYSFSSADNIYFLNVPDTVERIGKGAFYGCKSINQLWIPFVGESRDATVNNYFSYIFGSDNWADSSNYLPSFMDFVSISSATTIADYAFASCSKINSIGIFAPLTKIGSYSFKDTDINQVILPTELQQIGEGAFYHSRVSKINIPAGIKDILPYTFEGCENISDLEFGSNNLETIGNNAFKGCSSSVHLTLPNSVTTIGEGAFSDCTSLLHVMLSSSLTTIGSYAFSGCRNVWEFTYPNTKEKWSLVEKGESWADGVRETARVYCSDGEVDI